MKRGGCNASWIALAAAFLLAGCAPPPPDRPVEAEQFTFRSALTPYSAAICIARNARARPGATAEERTFGESGTEVIMRDSRGTLATARIERAGPHSSVRVRVSERVPGSRGAFAQALMTSC